MNCAKWIIFVAIVMAFSGACTNKPKTPAAFADIPVSGENAEMDVEQDTTIYGEAGDFGMSTFTLITDEGDTLYLFRTSSKGVDGQIFGSLKPGNRYAMTTTDEGEALSVVINLTQLERFTKDYSIKNGHLVLQPSSTTDTVHILALNDTIFTYMSENGAEQRIVLPEDAHMIKQFN